MTETARSKARKLAHDFIQRGDATGWFEVLYASANGDEQSVQWADMIPNPNLVGWFEHTHYQIEGRKALVIGCGLGDDAEDLASRGFAVTAFDISPTAIAWCQKRFPASPVHYIAADVLHPPASWQGAFDFVFEAYTLQVLPPDVRVQAIRQIASFVAPGGTLLVVCRGRDPEEDEGTMPWPLTHAELTLFPTYGLQQVQFEDYMDQEKSPTRRFRAQYRRESASHKGGDH